MRKIEFKTETSPGEHPRTFIEGHEYAKQEWGPLPHAEHPIIGNYQAADGTILSVSYLDEGPSGNSEFQIAYGEHGPRITVLDDSVVLQYLLVEGAATIEED